MSEIERQQTREIPTPMRWRTPRHLIPKLEIVNVAATAELNQFINLGLLVSVEGFVYNPDVYRCAYLKDENTRGKVSIFVSGKMISVGTKSFEDANTDLKHATRRLAKLRLIRRTRITTKMQNIVATGDLGGPVDIERLATKLPNVIYEPEQFPAAMYHATELQGASILVFASGKIVFAGLKDDVSLELGRSVLMGLADLVE